MEKSQEELLTVETLNKISNKIIEIVTIIFNELENEKNKKEFIRKWEIQKDILEQLTERNNNK